MLLKIPRDVINISINNEFLVSYLNHSVFFYVFLVSGLILLLIFLCTAIGSPGGSRSRCGC
ncbi:hypothetical protein ACFTAO_21530 [Paenibacillus rhizoplanae]